MIRKLSLIIPLLMPIGCNTNQSAANRDVVQPPTIRQTPARQEPATRPLGAIISLKTDKGRWAYGGTGAGGQPAPSNGGRHVVINPATRSGGSGDYTITIYYRSVPPVALTTRNLNGAPAPGQDQTASQVTVTGQSGYGTDTPHGTTITGIYIQPSPGGWVNININVGDPKNDPPVPNP
jgi:hypothetical protein